MELQDLQFSSKAFTDSTAGEEYWHCHLTKSSRPVLARLIPLSPQSDIWIAESQLHKDVRSPAVMRPLGYISKPEEYSYLVLLSEEAECNLASDIAERQRQGKWYEMMEIIGILEGCLKGLAAIYSSQPGHEGHGNLTPSSVFRSTDGSYKLGNFCSAMATIRNCGGPDAAYIHPQVLKNRTVHPWQVDLYDLGVLLLHLCELQEPLGINTEFDTAEKYQDRFCKVQRAYQNVALLQMFCYFMQAHPPPVTEHLHRATELLQQVKMVSAALSPSIAQFRAAFHPLQSPSSYSQETFRFAGTVKETRAEWLCSACTKATASCFCNCGGKETFLCDSCFPLHSSKSSRAVHVAMSVAAYGQHNLPGYFERLQRRSVNIPIATAEVRKNIEEIDKSIAQVSSEVQCVMAAVYDYGAMVIEQLQQIRSELEREINDSIKEVENTMHQDSPVLRNPMAEAIRGFSGDASRLQYFTFALNTTHIMADIQSMCSFTTTRPRENEYSLPGLQGNKLHIFHIDKSTYTTIGLSRPFSAGSKLCCIGRDEVLIVGSKPATAEAASVKIPTGQVTTLALMHTTRSYPGLIFVEKCAFVFGGGCIQCEKFDIRSRLWINLPNMHYAKSSFSPCRYRYEIYLIDVATCFECFHLNSEQFRLVQVNWYGLAGYSLCAYSDGEIVIVTSFKRMGRWRPESAEMEVMECSGVGASSQCPPVTFRNEIYFVAADSGILLSIDLNSRSITRK